MPVAGGLDKYEYLTADYREELQDIGANEDQWEKANQKAKANIDRLLTNYGHGAYSSRSRPRREVSVAVVGATGSGKSATANTLVGERGAFQEGSSANSVTTQVAARAVLLADGCKLTVRDTPGSWSREVGSSVDCYVVVVNLASPRFDAETYRMAKKSVKSGRYVTFLSHADDVLQDRTLADYMREIQGDPLHSFLSRDLRGRYLAVNNKTEVGYERQRNQEAMMNAIYRVMEEQADETTECICCCCIV